MAEFQEYSTALEGGLVLNGWTSSMGHKEVIFFTHGNGFCSRAYEPLLELLAESYDLLLIDVPGHGQSPSAGFAGYNQTAEYLHQSVSQSKEFIAERNVHVVAHSLGGMLTMLAASKHPDTFKSMVLLDPIMFPKYLLMFMHAAQKLKLTSLFHPHVKSTLRRRNGWKNKKEAFEYFHKRKIFSNWTDAALGSYVEYALAEADSPLKDSQIEKPGVILRCDPELEAQWFGSLPTGFWKSVENLRIPVALFMGENTYPFSQRAGVYAARINTGITYSTVPGGHCFMQEYPQQAADCVIRSLTS